MIFSVEVTNDKDETLTIVLNEPWDSGLAVTGIDGLGPEKATINTTPFSMMDGEHYNSSRIGYRNIVIKFQLLEDSQTNLIETTRIKTYKFFPVKKQIKLEFTTDSGKYYIYGYVESNEPDIFQKNVTTQISVICPDPYFRKIGKNIDLAKYDPKFMFKFSNESLMDKELLMGNRDLSKQYRYYDIEYDTNVETGIEFTFEMHGNDTINDLDIFNETTGEILKLENMSITDGYSLHVNTNNGNRNVYIIASNSEKINGMRYVKDESKWLSLTRGTNTIGYMSQQNIDNLKCHFYYDSLYEGI